MLQIPIRKFRNAPDAHTGNQRYCQCQQHRSSTVLNDGLATEQRHPSRSHECRRSPSVIKHRRARNAFPPVNEDSRDAALANFTYTYDQEEHYRLNANGIFYFTDSHGQSQAIQEYIGSKLTNYQNNYITRHNRFGTLNISNHLKGDNQWSLRSKTSMSIGHNYNTSLLSNSYNQILLNSSDETSARPFSVTQSVNFERRNAYGIFFTEANATYKSSEIHSFGDSYDNSHRLISASAEISGGWLLSRPNWHGNTLKLSARLTYKYTCEKTRGFKTHPSLQHGRDYM